MKKVYKPIYDKSYAVCVGIDKYSNLPPLENCVAGMNKIKELLDSQGYLVKFLTDQDATNGEIKNLINELSSLTNDDDRVFIYYAGHGLRRKNSAQEDVGLISAYDTGENYSNGIYFNELIQSLQFVKAKHIFMAFDACFSGLALSRSDDFDITFKNEDVALLAQNFLSRKSFEILTAGGQTERVYDRFPYNGPAGLSPFTYFLHRGINGEGAYKKLDGLVTGRSLAGYVRTNVQLYAPDQIPQYGIILGSEGEFVFSEKKNLDLNNSVIAGNNSENVEGSHNTQDGSNIFLLNLKELYSENWNTFIGFLERLSQVVGRRSSGSHFRILEDHALFNHLGFAVGEEEHIAYKTLLESPVGDIEIESTKPRLKMYFRRVKNVLDRFPLKEIDPSILTKWKDCVEGVINDLGGKEDDALIIRRVEDFAKSTLALTRFTTTSNDPELKAALYLIKKLDFADKGGSQKVERYLLDKIRKELEDCIDIASKTLFTEYLDDESNFWWGLLVLMDHSLEAFKLHDYRGLSGAEKILTRLITKEGVVSSSHGRTRTDVVYEIHSEYETILWITNLGFLIAQLLEKREVIGLPEHIREYILKLQSPYIKKEKIRPTGNIFIISLELEVWGRILAWSKGLAKDHLGRDLSGHGHSFLIRN